MSMQLGNECALDEGTIVAYINAMVTLSQFWVPSARGRTGTLDYLVANMTVYDKSKKNSALNGTLLHRSVMESRGNMFALVFWIKSKKTSILNMNEIGRDLYKRDELRLPYGGKSFLARVLECSEDEHWLRKIEVSEDAEIIPAPAKKKNEQTKRKTCKEKKIDLRSATERAMVEKLLDNDLEDAGLMKAMANDKNDKSISEDADSPHSSHEIKDPSSPNRSNSAISEENEDWVRKIQVSEDGETIPVPEKKKPSKQKGRSPKKNKKVLKTATERVMVKELHENDMEAAGVTEAIVDNKKTSKRFHIDDNFDDDKVSLETVLPNCSTPVRPKGNKTASPCKRRIVASSTDEDDKDDKDDKDDEDDEDDEVPLSRRNRDNVARQKMQPLYGASVSSQFRGTKTASSYKRHIVVSSTDEDDKDDKDDEGYGDQAPISRTNRDNVARQKPQPSDGPLTSNQFAVTIETLEPMIEKIMEKFFKKKMFTQTLIEPQPSIEIQPDSGVYVDQTELRFMNRWKNNPPMLIRKLLLCLVGAKNLINMTARGKGGKKGGKARDAVPPHILDAVKYYVDQKGVYKLSDSDFIRVVNLQCGTLRNPHKASDNEKNNNERKFEGDSDTE